MKKIISTLLSLALVIGMCPAMVSAETTLSGTGVEGDPYIIATVDDLKLARDLINADTDMDTDGYAEAHYLLTADLDLNNEEWTPIAPYVEVNSTTNLAGFEGTFDGGNHVIKNIKVHMTNDNASQYDYRPALGFFGEIENGTVKNLGLENVSVINDAQWVNTSTRAWENQVYAMGGFAGFINKSSVIENCFAKNVVVEQNQTSNSTRGGTGGFVGGLGNSKPSYTNCYLYNAKVTSATYGSSASAKADSVGAFLGNAPSAVVMTNCYAAKVTTDATTTERCTFYGFARITTTSSATVLTNCYSEIDDIEKSDATATAGLYNASYSRGTVGATKEAIVDAMTAVGYKTYSDVNNGYPCLAWEVPEDTLTGAGTVGDPYLIESVSDLKAARDLINDDTTGTGAAAAYYELVADIDLANEEWIPIAPLSTAPFTGTFDGNNHYVSNVSVIRTNDNKNNFGTKPALGFFGYIQNGIVENLGIHTVTVANDFTGYSNKTTGMGGFAGVVNKDTQISNSYAKNVTLRNSQTNQKQNMGGFIGAGGGNGIPKITNCYVYNVTVDSKCNSTGERDALGGFIGAASDTQSQFTNCYVAGVSVGKADTAAPFYAFGLISNGTNTKISECYSETSNIVTSYYSSDKAMGTPDTPIETLVQKMTAVGYKSEANINAGYPALSWETAPVAEVVEPYVVKSVTPQKTSYTVSSGAITSTTTIPGTVTLAINKADSTGDKVWIATYDSEGRLVSAEVKDVAANITTAVSGAATIKVFIWNGVTPVIDAVVKASY